MWPNSLLPFTYPHVTRAEESGCGVPGYFLYGWPARHCSGIASNILEGRGCSYQQRGGETLSQGHRVQGRGKAAFWWPLDLSDIVPKLKTVFLWAERCSYSTEVTTWGSTGRGTFKVTSGYSGSLAGRTAACLSLLPTGFASSCRVIPCGTSIPCGISSGTFPQSSSGPQRGSKRADGIAGSPDPPLAHRQATSGLWEERQETGPTERRALSHLCIVSIADPRVLSLPQAFTLPHPSLWQACLYFSQVP